MVAATIMRQSKSSESVLSTKQLEQQVKVDDLLKQKKNDTNEAYLCSPTFSQMRKRRLRPHGNLAKEAVKALLEEKETGNAAANQQQYHGGDLEQRKLEAFFYIRQMLNKQRVQKEEDKCRLIRFLREKPSSIFQRQQNDDLVSIRTAQGDDLITEPSSCEEDDNISPSITKRISPTTNKLVPLASKTSPSKKSAEQKAQARQALKALKQLNQQKRLVILRDVAYTALTKHHRRNSGQHRHSHQQQQHHHFAEERIVKMKLAVKQALLMRASHEHHFFMTAELLASAARKSLKKKAAIRLQSCARGFLVRRSLQKTMRCILEAR